ncbi:MAG: lipoyl synthase [Smithellaceae bacterium]
MNEKRQRSQLLRKPSWLKVRLPYAEECRKLKTTLAELKLHSVCQEAVCPNIAECFSGGTATFLILGNICTRHCLYCNVQHGIPSPVTENEVDRLITAVQKMNLKYIVITSVTRDDLPDGGAGIFANCINKLRKAQPDCKIEVLIPDFQGDEQALGKVLAARPAVINHNMETVRPMFTRLRPHGDYDISLKLLSRVSSSAVISKSGFMIGFGESNDDILRLIDDLAAVFCARLTIGQYQQPTLKHWPVAKYYHPDEFARLKEIACKLGFKHVEAGPLVRSSYHAARAEL